MELILQSLEQQILITLKKNIELIQKGPLDKALVSIIKSAFKDSWNSLT